MKVVITPEIVKSIYSLSVGASKDVVTPVIMQVALRREGDSLQAMTTDRYMAVIGTYGPDSVDFDEWPEEGIVLVPPAMLKRAVDAIKAVKFHSSMPSIEMEDHRVTVTVNGDVISDVVHQGNYPKLWHLIPGEDMMADTRVLRINPQFLARIVRIVPPEVKPEKEPKWLFRFHGSNSPVLAYYTGDGYRLDVLIQPVR